VSFFDLENELPGWLDGAINAHSSLREIVNQAVINQLDHTSLKSYHLLCADKGSMVSGSQQHHIWKFEAPKGNIRAYGKYLEFTGITPFLQFWIGIVVKDKTITFYLWFGKVPPPAVRQCLKSLLIEVIEKREYWYKEPTGNSGQASDILTECCGCGSPPLSEEKLGELEQVVKKAISDLLDAVEQAGKNI
jgi:hypothetical protein